jgi:hypothetical protein
MASSGSHPVAVRTHDIALGHLGQDDALASEPDAIVVPTAILPGVCTLIASQLGAASEIAFVRHLLDSDWRLESLANGDLVRVIGLMTGHRIGCIDAVVAATAERMNAKRVYRSTASCSSGYAPSTSTGSNCFRPAEPRRDSAGRWIGASPGRLAEAGDPFGRAGIDTRSCGSAMVIASRSSRAYLRDDRRFAALSVVHRRGGGSDGLANGDQR